VIAATNQPLEKLRSEGFFRDDFYYRLCSDVIVLPALRQRLMEDAGEMDILLENIVKRLLGEADPEVAGRVRAALAQSPGSDYPWPGNVRELEQAARRILLKGAYEGDTMHGGQGGISQRLIQGIQHAGVSAEEMLSLYARMLYDRTGSYGETGRVMEVDWRTAKKYVELQQGLEPTQ
jgi:transcriptional regulator with PAS, ATPase and Fis domain